MVLQNVEPVVFSSTNVGPDSGPNMTSTGPAPETVFQQLRSDVISGSSIELMGAASVPRLLQIFVEHSFKRSGAPIRYGDLIYSLPVCYYVRIHGFLKNLPYF